MHRLLLFLALILAGAPAPGAARAAAVNGGVFACSQGGSDCREVELEGLRLTAPRTLLVRNVAVAPEAVGGPRPLMVRVIALASSEIYWNGNRIGRNGLPASTAAGERPGRFIASFPVPPELVRPGANRVSARLSAHHLWLPVRRPVHVFEVAPYEAPELPGLGAYLPALLAAGALAAASIYFAAAAWFDRRDRGALLLALIAASVLLQLALETSRTFVAYTYPWHIGRVLGIAILAAVTAMLGTAYAAQRFEPARRLGILLATAIAACASAAFVPWFDLKALGAILAGSLGLIACARARARLGSRAARIAVAAGAALPILIVWQRTAFLDQAYYLFMAGLLVLLASEQLAALRQARLGRDAESRRAEALERRLSLEAAAGDAVVELRDGARTHRMAEAELVYVKAADDYCEVHLASGRKLLVTVTLARLAAALPPRFARVHKSYVVNLAQVVLVSPRPGGGKMLTLKDGASVPVGRSYAAAWRTGAAQA